MLLSARLAKQMKIRAAASLPELVGGDMIRCKENRQVVVGETCFEQPESDEIPSVILRSRNRYVKLTMYQIRAAAQLKNLKIYFLVPVPYFLKGIAAIPNPRREVVMAK
jgi:hypothetical protein